MLGAQKSELKLLANTKRAEKMYTYKFKKGMDPSLMKTLFVNDSNGLSNKAAAPPLMAPSTNLTSQPKSSRAYQRKN